MNELDSKEYITAIDVYNTLCDIYGRYMDDKASIPLYNLDNVDCIHRVWERLMVEYPKKLCCGFDAFDENDKFNFDFDADKSWTNVHVDFGDFKINPNRFIGNNKNMVNTKNDMDITYNYQYIHDYNGNPHTEMIDACLAKFNSNSNSI